MKTSLRIISWGFIVLALITAAFGIKYQITKDWNYIVITHRVFNLAFELAFIVGFVLFRTLAELVEEFGPFKDRH